MSLYAQKLNQVDLNKDISDSLIVNVNLGEVEIHGLIKNNLPFTIQNISAKQIGQTNLSDIGSIITKEPNIGGIKKGAMGIDPVIRGFSYSRVSVLLDGVTRIEGGCPNRMDPTVSHVNVNDISNITIYKGPFALKYGANFGGLINLETFNPIFHEKFMNNIRLFVGIQSNHVGYKSGIRVDGGNSSVSYVISANKNNYGDYVSGNGDIMKATSDNYNLSAKVGFRINKRNLVLISADKSWGRNVDFVALPMDERSDNTDVIRLSYKVTDFTNSLNKISVDLYHSNVNHEMDNKNRPFSDTVVALSKIHATNTGGRIAADINIFKGKLDFGTNFEHIYKDGKRYKWLIMQHGLPNFNENIWSNSLINNIGLFTEYQQDRGSGFSWILSARFDFNSANSNPMLRLKPTGDMVYEDADTKSNYSGFSFSAGVTWQLNVNSSVSVSIGKGVRFPDMTERFIILLPVGYDPYDYLGNPKLLPETNHEIDFGYNFSNSRIGNISTSVFFSYVTQYISTELVPLAVVKPQTKGVLGVKRFINIDDAYLTGFEIMFNTPYENKWHIKVNAAYTAGINPMATVYVRQDGEIVDEIIVKNDPLPEIPPFETNLWLDYTFLDRKIIPEINFRMVAAQSSVSQAYDEEVTPGFATINLKINFSYSDELQINCGVNNLLNTNYYEHLNRRVIGSRLPFYEPGILFYTNLIIKL